MCWWMGCGGWSSNATERCTPSLRKCLIRGLIIVSPRWVFSFGMQCAGFAKRSRRRDTSVCSHVKKWHSGGNLLSGVGGARSERDERVRTSQFCTAASGSAKVSLEPCSCTLKNGTLDELTTAAGEVAAAGVMGGCACGVSLFCCVWWR